MPLYLSMRGAVRAMTAASRGAIDEAVRDFAFALHGLQPGPATDLIAIGGLSGTGKSTLARYLSPSLAPPLGAIVIRSDVVRKRLSGTPPEVRLPAEAYAPAMNRKRAGPDGVRCAGRARAGAVVVLDATFLDKRRVPARARLPAAKACGSMGFGSKSRLRRLWIE